MVSNYSPKIIIMSLTSKELKKELVFICVASNFQWGKGKTQLEAMRNARVRFHDQFGITLIYTSNPKEVSVSGLGGVCWADDDALVLETPLENLWKVFNEDTWDDFINDRILSLAETEIRNRSKAYDDVHSKLADRIDQYIDKVVLQYD